MKKAILIFGLPWVMASCGNDAGKGATNSDTLGNSPSVMEGDTKHPGGVVNQNVISTDTAAMNVEKASDTTGGK